MCGVLLVGIVIAAIASSCGTSLSPPTAAQDIAAGVMAQRSGHFAIATASYRKALALNPDDVAALFDFGDVEQFEGLSSSAESHYEAALAADSKFVPAMYNLATLVAHLRPIEAEALYRDVIGLSPRDSDAHFNLGLILKSLGFKTTGNAQINIAIGIDPALR